MRRGVEKMVILYKTVEINDNGKLSSKKKRVILDSVHALGFSLIIKYLT